MTHCSLFLVRSLLFVAVLMPSAASAVLAKKLPNQTAVRVTVSDISKALEERQESIQSAEFAWFEHRDLQRLLAAIDGAEQADPDRAAPAECEFYLSGTLMRLNDELATSRNPDKNDVETYQSAYDGKRCVSLSRPRSGDLLGTIHKSAGNQRIANSGSVVPLLCATRPLHAMIMPMEALKCAQLSEKYEDVRGHRCLRVTLEEGAVHQGLVREVFVDVDRDFLILKLVDTPFGRTTGSTTIFEVEYELSADVKWKPVSWSRDCGLPKWRVSCSGEIDARTLGLQQGNPKRDLQD